MTPQHLAALLTRARATGLGFNANALHILAAIAANPHAPAGHIALDTGNTPAALHAAMKRLLRLGLITRTPGRDGRMVLLGLSLRGMYVLDGILGDAPDNSPTNL